MEELIMDIKMFKQDHPEIKITDKMIKGVIEIYKEEIKGVIDIEKLIEEIREEIGE